MKTKFTTIIATVALVLTTTFSFADGAVTSTELNQIGEINAIEAAGNVDVYIVNGDYDAVKVFDDYYSENAVISNVDGVLHIASYATDKLMVLVTVSDLKSIKASDNAFIKTYREALSAKSLEISLSDKATAIMQIDAISTDIKVNDQARAELYGAVENFNLDYAETASVSKSSLQSSIGRNNKIVEQPVITSMVNDEMDAIFNF